MKHIRSKYFTPGIHALIWILLLAIPSLIFHSMPDNSGLPRNFFLFTNIFHIGLFYFNAYFLYPTLLNRKRWWLYIPAIAAIIAVSFLLKLNIIKVVNPSFTISEFNIRILFFPLIGFLIASTIFRIIQDRSHFEKMKEERKAERLASELKFLRSQISPHFLFNMMTNMVSLARKKSDLLEPSLLKLSELLRYMLYESNEERFPINKEISYLRNYIELQQLRFGEDADVQLEISGDNSDCFIEPMLLVPFVENAFKHGIGMIKDPFIKIFLEIQHEHLLFRAINNYSNRNFSKDKNSGIGLVNVENRLNLLYPGKYTLNITDKNEIYTAELNLVLSC